VVAILRARVRATCQAVWAVNTHPGGLFALPPLLATKFVFLTRVSCLNPRTQSAFRHNERCKDATRGRRPINPDSETGAIQPNFRDT
jgi:hypothetical protein